MASTEHSARTLQTKTILEQIHQLPNPPDSWVPVSQLYLSGVLRRSGESHRLRFPRREGPRLCAAEPSRRGGTRRPCGRSEGRGCHVRRMREARTRGRVRVVEDAGRSCEITNITKRYCYISLVDIVLVLCIILYIYIYRRGGHGAWVLVFHKCS